MPNITPSLLAPDHLRVNLQHFAYNVQTQPHFSWWNHSNRTGASQSAYQLTVFQRLQDRQDHKYLYDSGWVTSSNNTAVTAAKLSDQLVAGQLYYWQVRIKDNAGNISDFSQPAKLICADPSLPVKHGIWRQPQPKTAQELAHIGQVVFCAALNSRSIRARLILPSLLRWPGVMNRFLLKVSIFISMVIVWGWLGSPTGTRSWNRKNGYLL